MGLTGSQKQRREISRKCSKILANFANAESLKAAIFGLNSDFKKAFKLKLFDSETQFKERRTSIREAQQRLTKLLDESHIDNTFRKSEAISQYIIDYYGSCNSLIAIDARYQNQNEILQHLAEKRDNSFIAVLAFLVLHYVRDKRRKPIIKCELPKCKLYFVAERNTAKYCSNEHKMCQFRIIEKLRLIKKRHHKKCSLPQALKLSHKKV